MTDAFSDIIGHHNISETFYTFFAERCSKAVLGSLGFGRHFGKVPFQTAKCDGETYGKIKYSIILFKNIPVILMVFNFTYFICMRIIFKNSVVGSNHVYLQLEFDDYSVGSKFGFMEEIIVSFREVWI